MNNATASIVIPAHNEQAALARTLTTLLDTALPGEFEIVVVCNGCTDRTREISEGFAEQGVKTLALDEPSKIAALNAGDAAVTSMPRIYIDADIQITTDSIRRLVTSLNAGALAAAPHAQLDLTGSSALVRSYFKIWTRLSHVSRGLGSGVYALSADGRSLFGEFPDVLADDYFVYSVVGGDDRVTPIDAISTVEQPRSIRDLARRRLRIEHGNAELRVKGMSAAPAGSELIRIVRGHPILLPNAALYAAIHLWARQRVRRKSSTDLGWIRDESTRMDGGAG
jgi:glycosyltransferase involved in cell wall biosynthesis